jgi:hypothetical protein
METAGEGKNNAHQPEFPSRWALNPLGDALPVGIIIHSIRRCLSQSSDICIQLEHDRSLESLVTIHLMERDEKPSNIYCKLYPSFYSTDWNDEAVENCKTITLQPYEIKAIRMSTDFMRHSRYRSHQSANDAHAIPGRVNTVTTETLPDQSPESDERAKQILIISSVFVLIAIVRGLLKRLRGFIGSQDWRLSARMRAKQV